MKCCVFIGVPFKGTGQGEYRSEFAEFFILAFNRFLLFRSGYKTSRSYILPTIYCSMFGRHFDPLKSKFRVTRCNRVLSVLRTQSLLYNLQLGNNRSLFLELYETYLVCSNSIRIGILVVGHWVGCV